MILASPGSATREPRSRHTNFTASDISQATSSACDDASESRKHKAEAAGTLTKGNEDNETPEQELDALPPLGWAMLSEPDRHLFALPFFCQFRNPRSSGKKMEGKNITIEFCLVLGRHRNRSKLRKQRPDL